MKGTIPVSNPRSRKNGKHKKGAAARRAEYWREMYYEKNVMGTKGDPFRKD